jgi:hypothetical protein
MASPITALQDLRDIHNALSPILSDIEILIDICFDVESDQRKTAVLHCMLESEAQRLRERLDELCCAFRSEVQP